VITILTKKFEQSYPTPKAYLSIFRIKTAEGFQYRLAAFAGASISIFWVYIEIVVCSVFYHYSDHPWAGINAGLTLPKLITYIWLAQIMFLIQPMNIDSDILSKIQSGDVSLELCRPLDLYQHWFAKVAAGRLVPLFWRGSIILIVGLLMPVSYRLMPPHSIAAMLSTLLSVFSAFLLCSAYGTLVCVIRLSVPWGDGPTYLIMLVGSVLSGSYLPLQLWPDFLQPFLLLQPFAGYLDIPLRFYLGTLSPNNILWAVGLQLSWSLIFIVLGKILIVKKINRLIIQGG
jgi:ABC-2 type transport system permease protein